MSRTTSSPATPELYRRLHAQDGARRSLSQTHPGGEGTKNETRIAVNGRLGDESSKISFQPTSRKERVSEFQTRLIATSILHNYRPKASQPAHPDGYGNRSHVVQKQNGRTTESNGGSDRPFNQSSSGALSMQLQNGNCASGNESVCFSGAPHFDTPGEHTKRLRYSNEKNSLRGGVPVPSPPNLTPRAVPTTASNILNEVTFPPTKDSNPILKLPESFKGVRLRQRSNNCKALRAKNDSSGHNRSDRPFKGHPNNNVSILETVINGTPEAASVKVASCSSQVLSASGAAESESPLSIQPGANHESQQQQLRERPLTNRHTKGKEIEGARVKDLSVPSCRDSSQSSLVSSQNSESSELRHQRYQLSVLDSLVDVLDKIHKRSGLNMTMNGDSMQYREELSSTLLAMSLTRDSCLAMRNSNCLPLLIELLHPSMELQSRTLPLSAAEILKPLDSRSRSVRERAGNALHNVVHANYDEDQCRREAKVLRLLEQIRSYSEQLRNSCGASQREKRCSRQFDQCPVSAALSLMKMSFDANHRQAISSLGGLHAICELLLLDWHNTRGLSIANGSSELTPYEQTQINRLSVNSNTISLEEQLSSDDRTLICRYACMTLTNLTFGDAQNKAFMCSLTCVLHLVATLVESCHEELAQVSASVIRNLSWRADSQSIDALRNIRCARILMRAALKVKQESSLKAILSALWNLSAHCTANKAEICSTPGALQFLVGTLAYQGSVGGMTSLAGSSCSSNQVRALSIVENGGGVLRHISSFVSINDRYRDIVIEAGCLQLLLIHLRSPSLTVVSNACGTLWNLSARSERDQHSLWDLGAATMLKDLVNSKHQMIANATLKNILSCRAFDDFTLINSYNSPFCLQARKWKQLHEELESRELTDLSEVPDVTQIDSEDNEREDNERIEDGMKVNAVEMAQDPQSHQNGPVVPSSSKAGSQHPPPLPDSLPPPLMLPNNSQPTSSGTGPVTTPRLSSTSGLPATAASVVEPVDHTGAPPVVIDHVTTEVDGQSMSSDSEASCAPTLIEQRVKQFCDATFNSAKLPEDPKAPPTKLPAPSSATEKRSSAPENDSIQLLLTPAHNGDTISDNERASTPDSTLHGNNTFPRKPKIQSTARLTGLKSHPHSKDGTTTTVDSQPGVSLSHFPPSMLHPRTQSAHRFGSLERPSLGRELLNRRSRRGFESLPRGLGKSGARHSESESRSKKIPSNDQSPPRYYVGDKIGGSSTLRGATCASLRSYSNHLLHSIVGGTQTQPHSQSTQSACRHIPSWQLTDISAELQRSDTVRNTSLPVAHHMDSGSAVLDVIEDRLSAASSEMTKSRSKALRSSSCRFLKGKRHPAIRSLRPVRSKSLSSVVSKSKCKRLSGEQKLFARALSSSCPSLIPQSAPNSIQQRRDSMKRTLPKSPKIRSKLRTAAQCLQNETNVYELTTAKGECVILHESTDTSPSSDTVSCNSPASTYNYKTPIMRTQPEVGMTPKGTAAPTQHKGPDRMPPRLPVYARSAGNNDDNTSSDDDDVTAQLFKRSDSYSTDYKFLFGDEEGDTPSSSEASENACKTPTPERECVPESQTVVDYDGNRNCPSENLINFDSPVPPKEPVICEIEQSASSCDRMGGVSMDTVLHSAISPPQPAYLETDLVDIGLLTPVSHVAPKRSSVSPSRVQISPQLPTLPENCELNLDTACVPVVSPNPHNLQQSVSTINRESSEIFDIDTSQENVEYSEVCLSPQMSSVASESVVLLDTKLPGPTDEEMGADKAESLAREEVIHSTSEKRSSMRESFRIATGDGSLLSSLEMDENVSKICAQLATHGFDQSEILPERSMADGASENSSPVSEEETSIYNASADLSIDHGMKEESDAKTGSFLPPSESEMAVQKQRSNYECITNFSSTAATTTVNVYSNFDASIEKENTITTTVMVHRGLTDSSPERAELIRSEQIEGDVTSPVRGRPRIVKPVSETTPLDGPKVISGGRKRFGIQASLTKTQRPPTNPETKPRPISVRGGGPKPTLPSRIEIQRQPPVLESNPIAQSASPNRAQSQGRVPGVRPNKPPPPPIRRDSASISSRPKTKHDPPPSSSSTPSSAPKPQVGQQRTTAASKPPPPNGNIRSLREPKIPVHKTRFNSVAITGPGARKPAPSSSSAIASQLSGSQLRSSSANASVPSAVSNADATKQTRRLRTTGLQSPKKQAATGISSTATTVAAATVSKSIRPHSASNAATRSTRVASSTSLHHAPTDQSVTRRQETLPSTETNTAYLPVREQATLESPDRTLTDFEQQLLSSRQPAKVIHSPVKREAPLPDTQQAQFGPARSQPPSTHTSPTRSSAPSGVARETSNEYVRPSELSLESTPKVRQQRPTPISPRETTREIHSTKQSPSERDGSTGGSSHTSRSSSSTRHSNLEQSKIAVLHARRSAEANSISPDGRLKTVLTATSAPRQKNSPTSPHSRSVSGGSIKSRLTQHTNPACPHFSATANNVETHDPTTVGRSPRSPVPVAHYDNTPVVSHSHPPSNVEVSPPHSAPLPRRFDPLSGASSSGVRQPTRGSHSPASPGFGVTDTYYNVPPQRSQRQSQPEQHQQLGNATFSNRDRHPSPSVASIRSRSGSARERNEASSRVRFEAEIKTEQSTKNFRASYPLSPQKGQQIITVRIPEQPHKKDVVFNDPRVKARSTPSAVVQPVLRQQQRSPRNSTVTVRLSANATERKVTEQVQEGGTATGQGNQRKSGSHQMRDNGVTRLKSSGLGRLTLRSSEVSQDVQNPITVEKPDKAAAVLSLKTDSANSSRQGLLSRLPKTLKKLTTPKASGGEATSPTSRIAPQSPFSAQPLRPSSEQAYTSKTERLVNRVTASKKGDHGKIDLLRNRQNGIRHPTPTKTEMLLERIRKNSIEAPRS